MVRKEDAKAKANNMLESRYRKLLAEAQASHDFHAYLKKKHGNVIRAWLCDIDLDGSMAVQQKELFKACRMAQWRGDVRALWRAMDSDQSGVAGLEEVDAFAAEMLAHFRARAIDKYGSCVDFFIACDVHREGKLRPETFVSRAR